MATDIDDIDKLLSVFSRLKELFEDTEQKTSCVKDSSNTFETDRSRIEVLKIAIDEQRRTQDELGGDLDSLSTKILTVFGGALALLAYLYVGGNLFIPKSVYGKIFYFIGLSLVFIALYNLVEAIRPSGLWEVPTEHKKLEVLDEDNQLEYLKYVKGRYVSCFKNNVSYYSDKRSHLNKAFYPLIVGGIILVVLKSFGG